MKTVVAIPTLGESPYLIPLLDKLLADGGWDELVVMDDRPEGVEAPIHYIDTPRVSVWPRTLWDGRGFYGMFNAAWRHAKVAAKGQPANLVLLNDDIAIPEDFVVRLCATMRSDDRCWCAYPDWRRPLELDEWGAIHRLTPTKGTYKHGGLWGCAFALRAELLANPLPAIDEQFAIWCGDDDLVKQIDLHGGLTCRVEGLAVEHYASTTFNQHGELHEIGWEDVKKFKAKYGEGSW